MVKIGFLTDIHYRCAVPGTSRIARRECRLMPDVLERCLDAFVAEAVDAVVCAGDCVDEADAPGVMDDLASLSARFDATGLPTVILPGNHDPAPEDFYRIIAQPPRRLRVGNVEVISFFDDMWQPGLQRARRRPEVLEAMRSILEERPTGVDVTFLAQHYVVFPSHMGSGYDHTLENRDEVRGIMEKAKRPLVVLSGHLHAGSALSVQNGVTYFTGKALCERPFHYYVFHVEAGGEVRLDARSIEVSD